MKEFIKKNIKMIVIVIGILSLTGIVAYATGTYVFESTDVRFDNTNTEITAGDVQGALEEVYNHVTDYNEIKDQIGNNTLTTTSQTLTGGINELNDQIGNLDDHNAVFRGKSLGSSVTSAQWTAISSGTFTDLYVGDYWTINGVNWRIAGFDIYYNKGDTCGSGTACKKHHAVIVPDTNLTSAVMNDTNTTTGGYVGSKMYTETLPTVLTTVRNAFGTDHVLKYRALLTNSVNTSYQNRLGGNSNGASNGWAWYDAYINLMNMVQVTGNIGFSSSGYDTGADNVQFPLFRLRPEFINKQRSWYWVRDVVSSAHFALVYDTGYSSHNPASYSAGVRPCFYIG